MTDTQKAPETPVELKSEDGFTIPSTYIEGGKILGKFASVHEMLDYLAGGGTVDSPASNTPPAPGTPETAPATPVSLAIPEGESALTKGLAADEINRYSRELATKGQLSPESYTALEAKGYTKDFVDTYIQGQKAIRQLEAAQVIQKIGGQAQLDATMKWAKANLSKQEQASFNAAISAADVDAQALLLRGLMARAGINSASVMGTNSPAPQNVPFASEAEYQAAMNDPRYTADARYREEVFARTKATMQVNRR